MKHQIHEIIFCVQKKLISPWLIIVNSKSKCVWRVCWHGIAWSMWPRYKNNTIVVGVFWPRRRRHRRARGRNAVKLAGQVEDILVTLTCQAGGRKTIALRSLLIIMVNPKLTPRTSNIILPCCLPPARPPPTHPLAAAHRHCTRTQTFRLPYLISCKPITSGNNSNYTPGNLQSAVVRTRTQFDQ